MASNINQLESLNFDNRFTRDLLGEPETLNFRRQVQLFWKPTASGPLEPLAVSKRARFIGA